MLKAEIVPGQTIDLDPDAMVFGAWRKVRGGISSFSIFEIELVYRILSQIEQPFMIDIGAHVGVFTLLTALVPGMRCEAFEPNPDVFNGLRKNLELNNISDRVALHQCALGDRQGRATLSVPQQLRAAGLATLGKPSRGKECDEVEVDVIRLDSLEWPKVDFIKIDVEGAELDVLRGARQTIEEHHPQMLVECAEKNTRQFGYTPRDILEMLAVMNYKTVAVGKNDRLAVCCD
jgi:FkbM family methyltransferase